MNRISNKRDPFYYTQNFDLTIIMIIELSIFK